MTMFVATEPAKTVIRVLVADDHPLIRVGIRQALEADDFEVCAEAADADGAVAAALRERPDICLLDVRMPGDGILAAQRILAEVPEAVVVMLTVSTSEHDLLAAVRAGARGFLLKDMRPKGLLQALRGVLAGEAAMPRGLTGPLLAELRSNTHRLEAAEQSGGGPTAREADVLVLLRQGHGTEEIAARLFISPATVRSHISALVRKFQVQDRAALQDLFRTA